jgi:nitrous oxidase accessory protein NosD
MKLAFTTFFLSLSAAVFANVDLKAGMVITGSVTINANRYTLNASADLKQPLLVIDGNNITVDFNQAILQGSNDKSQPDEFYGLAILVKKGSKNITIKNAEIHGYKVAILADSVTNITIDNCDLSYNWRQHLQSNREREDISDWMSYHKNENDEWLRYGAAIYLKNCSLSFITNNTVTGGQCALMMTRCEKIQVNDNNFAFNSGIGIGLYRSSYNRIYHNRIDYNIRGVSFGKYNRGQDSAGILVFEQSSNNVFAYNTATHSGDGFFLWAGQTTMDTGLGGCNDNFIYGNDFSYAPTNGIEVTFSSNLIMKNILKDCDHGVWAGYSYETDITDNRFENNRIGIAIEHGQAMNIVLNSFKNDRTGIKLWSREKQPEDWIYAKKRNTESRNYWIAVNRFTGNQKAFDIMGTDTVIFSGNTKLDVEENLVLGDRAENIDTSREEELLDMDYQKDERLKAIKDTQMPAAILPQGKKEMRITEWGPYDFNYPIVWLKSIDSTGLYHFEILGPKGNWTVENTTGFTITNKGETNFPSMIDAQVNREIADRNIRLKYTGPSYRDAFGKKMDSASPHVFAYREFQPLSKWDVNFYKWDADHDPAKDYNSFIGLFDGTPVYTTSVDKPDYIWWNSIGKDLPADSFATVAVTKMILEEKEYSIGITADDYVKLFIDGKEIIDAWNSQYTELDENTHHRVRIRLSKGEHSFKIVHAENKGLATLQFYMQPVVNTP